MTAKCFHYLWLPTIYIVHLGISTPTHSLSLPHCLSVSLTHSLSLKKEEEVSAACILLSLLGGHWAASPSTVALLLPPSFSLSLSPIPFSSLPSLPVSPRLLHGFIIAVARRHHLCHRQCAAMTDKIVQFQWFTNGSKITKTNDKLYRSIENYKLYYMN